MKRRVFVILGFGAFGLPDLLKYNIIIMDGMVYPYLIYRGNILTPTSLLSIYNGTSLPGQGWPLWRLSDARDLIRDGSSRAAIESGTTRT